MVSVIMPAHNARATIGATLRSLAPEREIIRELILVDDSSTDDTIAVARQEAATLGLPLVTLNACCRDAGGARNMALDAVSGRWIYFFDADDIHIEGGLRTLLRAAEANGETDLVVGAYYRLRDGHHSRLEVHRTRCFSAEEYLTDQVRSIAVGSALIAREALDKHRFPVGLSYDEDTIFWAQIINCGDMKVLPDPIMIYQTSSQRGNNRFMRMPKRDFLAWRKALRELEGKGIDREAIRMREGIVALKIARIHFARNDMTMARRFLRVASSAPQRMSVSYHCLRYWLKIAWRQMQVAKIAS